MELQIKNYLLNLELGKLQSFKKMGVIPLSTSDNNGPKYVTLKEALEKDHLTIKEVSEGGSVPELMVVNKADFSVLLLDGEELMGAKQNRVLNTSILLKKKSETIIPVSCTEQRRWSYNSEIFADSEVVMSPKIRMKKAQTVSSSLHESKEFKSDQSAVWYDIHKMSSIADVESSTGAMKDVFDSKQKDLDEYIKAFEYTPRQKGMLVFLDGEVVGFDILSSASAYKGLHQKLVKSYAMEAVLLKKGESAKSGAEKAKAFIKEITACKGKRYESVGNGWDHRFEGKQVVGSALVYGENVIHAAFFKITEEEKTGSMSGLRRRKGYRTN